MASTGSSADHGSRASPLIVVTVTLLVGQLLAGWQVVLPVAAGLSALVLAIVALRFGRTRTAGIALVACLWGYWSTQRILHPTLSDTDVALRAADGKGSPRSVEGRLLADADRGPRRTRLQLQAERIESDAGWQEVTGRVLVTIREPQHEWRGGDLVRAPLPLRRPRNFGNPGEFDYAGYLARQQVYATAFLEDDEGIELRARPASGGWLSTWRREVGELIDGTLSEPERAVLRALIIGDTAGVPPPLQRAFINAGVNHVLSISGLHIGMVAAIGYALWRWLLARSRWLLLRANVPKLAAAASSIAVLLYAGIAGSNPATLRSVIMVLVFVGAVVVDRQRDLLVSLAAAALAICLLWPGSVLDISFQLSFVAVLFLALGMSRFWPWWRRVEERRLLRLRHGPIRLLRPAAAYLAVSLSAMVGTAPLTAFYFNQVSWVALLANALVVPLLGTVAVACGLAAALLFPFSQWLARIAVYSAWPSLWLGDRLVELFGALPHACVRVVTPSLLELALSYGALLAVTCLRDRARAAALVLIGALALADGGWWYRERFQRSDLRITFLSVGQGDSAVVECPPSAVMVIDGGGVGDGSFDIGERVIAPFLWSRKIAHVDVLAMSHPQWDHYGGLTFLAQQFAPREFWSTGEESPDSVHFAALQQALAESEVRQMALTAGSDRRCGEVLARVLSPGPLAASVNDRSLVLQLQHGPTRVIFTGDIEGAAEAELLASADGRLASTVLKVPHHGSATSSTPAFVAAVAPRWAVASVGFGNRFGFPPPQTLQAYDHVGAYLLRTDRDGAVIVGVDSAGRVAVQTYRHPPDSGGPPPPGS